MSQDLTHNSAHRRTGTGRHGWWGKRGHPWAVHFSVDFTELFICRVLVDIPEGWQITELCNAQVDAAVARLDDKFLKIRLPTIVHPGSQADSHFWHLTWRWMNEQLHLATMPIFI